METPGEPMHSTPSTTLNLQARDAVLSGDLAAALELIQEARASGWGYVAACALASEAVCNADHPRAPFLRLALDNGADANHVQVSGHTLLTQLCNTSRPQDDSVELARMLLDAGAEVDPFVEDEEADPPPTPLMFAAQSNAVPLVELLLAHGADMNAIDGNLETPLAHAVSGRAADTLQMLVDRGADFKQLNSSGIPPLYALFSDGLFETEHDYEQGRLVAEVLLQAGADLDANSMHGDSPRDLLVSFPDAVRNAIILAKKAEDQAGVISRATRDVSTSRPRRAL